MTPSPSATSSSPALVPTDPTSISSWWSWLVGAPLRILLIVVIAFVALAVLRTVITKVTDGLARPPARTPGERDLTAVLVATNPVLAARRAQRAHTVGSVLRSVASLFVGLIAVLMVLDTLGINLAPLLASAGVVGVALGIGAQSLVRDFLSGLFMLAEDQYGVGDVIDVGTTSGKVESVGLRVTTIRDDAGTLWFVPNGSITRVGNKTQQWANASVEIDVDYFADLALVTDLLLAAAHRVVEEPSVAGDIQGEPSVSGIERLSAEAVTLKVSVRTSPARQWEVSRQLRAAVRDGLTDAQVRLGGQRDLWLRHRNEDDRNPED